MLFLYFSGTGNTRFCIEYLAKKLDAVAPVCSIEQPEATNAITENQEIILGYPVYYSNLPKILRDFILDHADLWRGKKIFLLATMGLFSGDGAGVAGRLLKKQGAVLLGGSHIRMPDCILDVKALKASEEKNKRIVQAAERKLDVLAQDFQKNKLPQDGLSIWNHIAGLLCQRLYFFRKTGSYTERLKIDRGKCIACGRCSSLCPMKNIVMEEKGPEAHDRCTMCYRCINNCPEKAITLIGKQIVAEPFDPYM